MPNTSIIARNLEAARRFYTAASRPLGLNVLDWPSGFMVGQLGDAEPIVRVREARETRVTSEAPASGPVTLQARDDYSVRAFYRAALEAGGRQVGYPAPQPTQDGQSYYAAQVEDPDGNLVECGWRH